MIKEDSENRLSPKRKRISQGDLQKNGNHHKMVVMSDEENFEEE